jgi:hypothetical protein
LFFIILFNYALIVWRIQALFSYFLISGFQMNFRNCHSSS